jgi:hypothetical protein
MLPILLTELVDGKEPEYGEEEHHILKADPPEEIAAWDVWAEELKTVRRASPECVDGCGSRPGLTGNQRQGSSV